MQTKQIGLITRQWQLYPNAHRNRTNLIVHMFAVPLFLAGTVGLPLALFVSSWLAPAGIASMAVALGLQGRAHGREQNRPPPFRGTWDMLARILLEQWITFPRFVLTGGFKHAWHGQDSGA